MCDVLAWMNASVPLIAPNYNGLKTDFTQTMELKFKHLALNPGGRTIGIGKECIILLYMNFHTLL